MSMKKAFTQGGLLLLTLAFAGKADIIYDMSLSLPAYDNSQPIGMAIFTGTIETDGTLGSLLPNGVFVFDQFLSTIISTNITANFAGQAQYDYVGAGQVGIAFGPDLTATPQGIYFNFTSSNLFNGPDDTVVEGFGPFTLSNSIGYDTPGIYTFDPSLPNFTVYLGTAELGNGPLAGNVLLASVSAAPEPPFFLLTGIGFVGLVFVAYSRRHLNRA